jgi:hypothetical protein
MRSALAPLLLLPLLGLGLLSCSASRQYFRPAERARAESMSGRAAAEYDLGVEGTRWGEARIWSDGARSTRADGERRSSLHVGFEVENALDTPLSLDLSETRLEGVMVDGRRLESVSPAQPWPEAEAAPHQVMHIDLVFELPDVDSVRDIGPFRVRWVLLGPDGWRYEQHTGFLVDYPARTHYHEYYWGPPPWGWTWGWGWGWGWSW